MARKKKCIAMLLAGGQGSRLAPLTENVAKPAVPFGGRYRIIDFSLSNCVNSGLDTVGVLTQYQPLELNDYLGTGDPWDLDLNFGGLHVLPPYQAAKGGDWFKGTANAIYQNAKFISNYDPDYIIVLSGDHIYKMNYDIMLQEHINNDAVIVPSRDYCGCSVHHIFPILCHERDMLQQWLKEQGVMTLIHYPIPPHLQQCYSEWKNLNLPITERIHREELSLPCNQAMTEAEVEKVVTAVNSFNVTTL